MHFCYGEQNTEECRKIIAPEDSDGYAGAAELAAGQGTCLVEPRKPSPVGLLCLFSCYSVRILDILSMFFFQSRRGDTSTLQNQRGMLPKMRPDSWDGHSTSFENY